MISIIMFFLGKGIKSGNKLDSDIYEYLNKVGDNYIIKISILNEKPCLCFWKENNKIYFKVGGFARRVKADLKIVFKSKRSAKDVMFGEKSIAEAFAEHSLVVYGDISKAMEVVPILEKVELYLFPKFISKDILPGDLKQQVCKFRYYMNVLFSI